MSVYEGHALSVGVVRRTCTIKSCVLLVVVVCVFVSVDWVGGDVIFACCMCCVVVLWQDVCVYMKLRVVAVWLLYHGVVCVCNR